MSNAYDKILDQLDKLEKALEEALGTLDDKEVGNILDAITKLETEVDKAIAVAAKKAPPTLANPTIESPYKKEDYFPSGGTYNHASAKEQPKEPIQKESEYKSRQSPNRR